MRRFSITDKLIIASLALSTITIIIVASYSFTNAKQAILERTFNQLTSVRVIKSNLLDKFFGNCIKEVKMAKSSADLIEVTEKLNQTSKTQPNCETEILLKEHQIFVQEIKENFYHRILILGKNGSICSLKEGESDDDFAFNSDPKLWEDPKTTDIRISDLSTLEDGTKVIGILAPIFNHQEAFLGHIYFEIASYSIDSIMLEVNPSHGLGISGESYLVGADFLMRSSSRFQTQSVLKTKVETKAVLNALAGVAGTDLINDYRGVKVLSSYSQLNLPQLNWVIISEIDYKEATIPIYRIRNEIIFISIFIFFLVLIVIFIISRRITIPIQKLNEAANEISSGNLNIDLKTNLKDEIGELTKTFNIMALELKNERAKSLGSLIDGQETERQRLSRELHDSLGQSLIGLKLKYEACINQSNSSSNKNQNFEELSLLFDRTIEETRRISNNLMPAVLKEFGLFSAMRHLCNEIANTSNIKIDFKTSGKDQQLNDKTKVYVFRITQEAITNILKHAAAKHASILIYVTTHSLLLEIEDDGVGFSKQTDSASRSNGLHNIKDRIEILQGSLDITSAKNKGTFIKIKLPIKLIENGKD